MLSRHVMISLALLPVFLAACASKPSHYSQYARQAHDQPFVQVGLVITPRSDERFRGELSAEGVGGNAQPIMYAGGAPGLVGGVIGQMLVNSAVNNDRKQQAVESADRVLSQYRVILAGFDDDYFVTRGLAQLTQQYPEAEFSLLSEHPADTGYLLEVDPLFFLAQDEQSITLHNTVKIYRDLERDQLVYQNVVQVLSADLGHAVPFDHWSADKGMPLGDELLSLFKESVDMAVADARNQLAAGDAREQTIEYQRSGRSHFERGTVLRQSCERITVRTLRGWLLSLPTSGCQQMG